MTGRYDGSLSEAEGSVSSEVVGFFRGEARWEHTWAQMTAWRNTPGSGAGSSMCGCWKSMSVC